MEFFRGKGWLTLQSKEMCIAEGHLCWQWSRAGKACETQQRTRSLQQSRQRKTAGKNREQKKPGPRGHEIFFSQQAQRGNVQTSALCKSQSHLKSNWVIELESGLEPKDLTTRTQWVGWVVYKTFLFIICLILSLLSFKKFILVHVVMQSGSRACISRHGSGGTCSEK